MTHYPNQSTNNRSYDSGDRGYYNHLTSRINNPLAIHSQPFHPSIWDDNHFNVRDGLPRDVREQSCRERVFLVSLTRVRGDDWIPAFRIRSDKMVRSSIHRVDFNCLGVVATEVESVDDNFFKVSRSSLFELASQYNTPSGGRMEKATSFTITQSICPGCRLLLVSHPSPISLPLPGSNRLSLVPKC